ncbi:MAG: ankyrin repeat domain-containing protein [Spirochaetales bacterium]|nr:ankyrin repeat domain-containing protein [Spirochaetales bacterium]
MKTIIAIALLTAVCLAGCTPRLSPEEQAKVDAELIKAITGGTEQEVKALLDKGADANASTEGGQTALMFAADEDNAEKVKLLLARGADPNAKNSNGFTALIIAQFQSDDDIIQLLLDAGAKEE